MLELALYHHENRAEVLKLIVYLQEFERSLEPESKRRGDEIAETLLETRLRKNEQHNGRLVVAKIDEVIVGFANGYVVMEPDEVELVTKEWFFISDLVVLPNYQKQGIGRALIASLQVYAREIGQREIRICTLMKNERARRVYEKMGFRPFEMMLSMKE